MHSSARRLLQHNLTLLDRTGMGRETNKNSLLSLVKRVNNFYLNELGSSSYLPLFCQSHQVGLISTSVLSKLTCYPEVFTISDESVKLSDNLNTFDKRNVAIDRVLRNLRNKDELVALRGWRDECYEIKNSFAEKPLFRMERSATPLFGARQYGVHINGFVKHSQLGLCLWLQRRSPTKQTWPNLLDSFVGGGLSEGNSVLDTALKEAGEEANVPRKMAEVGLKHAGSVSFFHQTERGIHPNTEFVFDLELPEEFIPSNNDGEVSDFQLVPAEDLPSIISSQDFKTTSSPVVLDWLIRRGLVTLETEPNLPEVVELLHLPLHHLYRGQH